MTGEPAWGPVAVGRGDKQPRTLTGMVVARLRDDIISNRLDPGAHLSITELARRYDVGSSPVREALFQVASEGLVHGAAHRGFHVARINTAEMLDISTLRADLEARALRSSIDRGGSAWMDRLAAAGTALAAAHARVSEASPEAYPDAADEWELKHRQLHLTLCSNCGSPWLLHFVDVLYDHLERYRRYFWNYRARVGEADDEHEAIVQAALTRDADRAVALLYSHFQTQAELSLRARSAPEPSSDEELVG